MNPILEAELVGQDGSKVRLAEKAGRPLVVYFYPRAMTPGCTREAQAFNKLLPEFEKLGSEVYGVSTDPPEKNKRFAEKLKLNFKLLSDPDGRLASQLGILKPGTKKPTAERTTYLIVGGRIAHIIKNVRPAEKHAELALEKLREALREPTTPEKE